MLTMACFCTERQLHQLSDLLTRSRVQSSGIVHVQCKDMLFVSYVTRDRRHDRPGWYQSTSFIHSATYSREVGCSLQASSMYSVRTCSLYRMSHGIVVVIDPGGTETCGSWQLPQMPCFVTLGGHHAPAILQG